MTISFLASHNGTSVKYIIEAIKSKKLNAQIGIVITNNLNSQIYEWCIKNHIKVKHISGTTNPINEDDYIATTLETVNTDIVILSGYMKKIGSKTISKYENKILNIHPSLLPKYGGEGLYGDKVHKSVLESKDTISGATVHIVSKNYDEGEIISQSSVEIMPLETIESLKKKVQALEGELYLRSIKNYFLNR